MLDLTGRSQEGGQRREPGDLVRKGQALLVLDTNDLELQLEQAEAEVRAATTTSIQR